MLGHLVSEMACELIGGFLHHDTIATPWVTRSRGVLFSPIFQVLVKPTGGLLGAESAMSCRRSVPSSCGGRKLGRGDGDLL